MLPLPPREVFSYSLSLRRQKGHGSPSESRFPMTDKIDFKKTLDTYRAQQGKFRLVEVPVLQYLMIDGHGDPNTSPMYAQALEALYPVAYKMKFASKRDLSRDYVVPPLEGLWWADDMDAFTSARDKSRWDWTMMLMARSG